MSIAMASTVSNSKANIAQSSIKKTLTQEDFINILVTQMKYQNPLEPLNNEQMAMQIAQMSSVNALQQMEQTMKNMAAKYDLIANLQATSLVGKKVEVAGNQLYLIPNQIAEGVYQLPQVARVTIQIYDSLGNLVRSIDEGRKEVGKQKFSWNGQNNKGEMVAEGLYTFVISAVDEKGNEVPVSPSQIGEIKEIAYENGTVYFLIGRQKYNLESIIAILS
ncbi:MAG: flagellar hook assembly protein FlgD [Thermodesulfobacteriota bacterium]